MDAPTAGAAVCVGCHALSRDGKRMAIGSFIPAPATYKVYDVATRSALSSDGGTVGGLANFFSFNPDGTKLLVSDGVKIALQDVATGTIENASLVAAGSMPDWSPDGAQIVYAKGAPPPFGFAQPGAFSAALEIVSYQNGSVGTPTVLVPFTGQNNYYPAFSPSQKWVIFNRSPSNTDSFSAGPPTGDGQLWAVPTAGGNAIKLDTANEGGSCSWPKWAPDIGTYYGGTIMYFTVASARAYGLRLTQGAQVQLWMVGFDPKRGEQGQDPSLPSFWFPFQDLASGNHIAQWVTSVERQPCTKIEDCTPGEQCDNGKCVPIVK
jgi:TolB protein